MWMNPADSVKPPGIRFFVIPVKTGIVTLWRFEKALPEIHPFPGHPQASQFPGPEFFHSFRGMKGDLTAFQKANL
jgi:hypothetical protein